MPKMTEERRQFWREKYKLMRWQDILRFENIEYQVRSTGRILAHCVFHVERTPSLVFYPNMTYKCYGCGVSGHVVDFILNYHDGVGEPWLHDTLLHMPVHDERQLDLFSQTESVGALAC